MKTVIAAIAAFGLFSAMALAAAPSDQTFVDLENAWLKALIAKDEAALKTIIAPDWSGQSESAKRETRDDEIALVKTGKLKITSAKIHDVKVRVIGTIAIVQGFDDEKSTFDGKDSGGTYGWTDVFENRGGKWVAVASQVTKLKK